MRVYQVAFYNTDGALNTVLDLTNVLRMRYRKVLNMYGAFQMTVPYDLARPVMQTLDAPVQVMSSDGAGSMSVDGTYLLRHWNPITEDDRKVLVIAGVGLEHLLARRIFLADDDPDVANGFSTKSGAADDVIADIITDQAISPDTHASRQIANLAVASTASAGSSIAFREESSDVELLALLGKLADSSDVDFWIEFTASPLAFTVQVGTRGTDRRKSTYPTGPYTVFSSAIGNIDRPDYVLDRRDEKNHVWVFGQGPTGEDLVYNKEGSGLTDSPWNRCEVGVQARNTKTVDDWITEADAALADARRKLKAFSFTPRQGAVGAAYKTNWDLGDRVTVLEEDEEIEMRITAVTVDVDASGEHAEPEMELL